MYDNYRPLPLGLAVADKAMFTFSNQWLAGLQPRLLLETDPDGRIWVTSQVVAGDAPTHAKLVLRRPAEKAAYPHFQAGEAGQRRRPRHHGPSRQRRRLRREAARAATAATVTAVEEAAEKAADAEKAVVVDKPETVVSPIAEEAAQSPTQPSQVATAEVVPPPSTSPFTKMTKKSGQPHQMQQLLDVLPPDLSSHLIPLDKRSTHTWKKKSSAGQVSLKLDNIVTLSLSKS